jgi:hypothetical protein
MSRRSTDLHNRNDGTPMRLERLTLNTYTEVVFKINSLRGESESSR